MIPLTGFRGKLCIVVMAVKARVLLVSKGERGYVSGPDNDVLREPGPEMRDKINAAMKQAMRDKRSEELSTLRLINAAIKDRDIAARGEGNHDGIADVDILGVLGKMIKQRQDSAQAYEEAGRLELAEKERSEIGVIETFLPRQLDEEEVRQAVTEAIAESGAESIRDMGRVMSALKEKYSGQMDFAKAGAAVKDTLA